MLVGGYGELFFEVEGVGGRLKPEHRLGLLGGDRFGVDGVGRGQPGDQVRRGDGLWL